MQWSDGKSAGTTSVVKRSAVKKGTISIGKKVSVAWGKSKKTYNAVVIDDSSGFVSPRERRAASEVEEDPMTMVLGAAPSPATETQSSTINDGMKEVLEKLDRLADDLSGVEARMCCRFQALQDRLDKVQKDVADVMSSRSVTRTQQTEQNPDPVGPEQNPVPVRPLEQNPVPLRPELPNFGTPTQIPTPLSDISNSTAPTGFGIVSHSDVLQCLNACRSRRNFASRLALKTFTATERAGSNCRGACGKKALNCFKVKSIFQLCVQHFPLDRLETSSGAEKEMRNAIDEVCRKTKIKETENIVA